MAYLSLYRKYRPQTFDEILGQSHVSQTLSNAISENRVSHAYLFTGPRGTGKTSTARILAKALNCIKGPTPSPCGECDSCRSIADGSSLDVIELDAASHSKVDETRDVLAGVALATAGGRKKVYVIDEVHMLSAQSFNALLKTLEEPPDHVVFILATTEAHKVLSTIVSRTQRFDFRRVPTEILEQHLARIAEAEGIQIDADAVRVVARHADGGVRDAISVLDQLSNVVGRVAEADAEALLGLREEDSYHQLLDAIADGDVGAVFNTLHSLVGQGSDPRQLALGVLAHVRSLLLLRTSPDSEGLLNADADDLLRFGQQAQRFSVEALLRTLELVGKALTEMRTAPNHRLLLEVALVRAAAPDTDPSALGLQGRIERLERRVGIAEGAPSAEVAPAVSAPAASAQPARTAPAPTPQAAETAPAPARKTGSSRPTPQPDTPAETPAAAPAETAEPAAEPATAAAVPDSIGLTHIRDAWAPTLTEVSARSKRIWGLLNPSRPVGFDDGHLVVEVQSGFHESTMSEEPNRSILAEALFSSLGVRPTIGFVARGSVDGPPPLTSAPAAATQDAPASAAPQRSVAAQKEAPAGKPRRSAKQAAKDPDDPDADDAVDVEDTTLAGTGEHDPVELVKKGLSAEVVEERTIS